MRSNYKIYAALVGGLLAAGSAGAQTCAAPSVIAGAQGPTTFNTCTAPTGTGTNDIGTYCNVAGSTENEILFKVVLGAGATGSFSLTNVGAAFNPAIVPIGASDTANCQLGSNCVGLPVDANGNGGNESVAFSALGAGTFYIAVTGSPGGGTCGAFDLTVTPTLPVLLQNFNVE